MHSSLGHPMCLPMVWMVKGVIDTCFHMVSLGFGGLPCYYIGGHPTPIAQSPREFLS
jgi:hypothetical protein